MNDTNNNLNGTVLGNVNNDVNVNNNPMPNNENVEMLDMGTNPVAQDNQAIGVNPNVGVNNEVQSQSTFFNNPPVNEVETNANEGFNSSVVNEPLPSAQPAPAYTSLQQIDPTPMPGFENSNMIGTTPPINLEPEKQPKNKKSNKILFIILVLIVLAGVGFGTYYVLNYTDLLNKETKISIKTKDIEINIGDELSDEIKDYATISGTDTKNCSLDKTNVKVSEIGEYTYKITCGKTVESGKITVVDNSELIVKSKTVYKSIGESLEASEFINELNSEYAYEFVDAETVKTNLTAEGVYTIKINATGKNDKTIEIDAKLVVLQYPIKGYLTCSSNGQNITDSSATMTISNKFAIAKDINNQNIYGKVAFEVYSFKYTDETEYTNLLATYKTDGKITINNISGETEFNDQELTITISKEKENTELYTEHGETTFEKFSTIKSYFESTKGYTCTYKNENA